MPLAVRITSTKWPGVSLPSKTGLQISRFTPFNPWTRGHLYSGRVAAGLVMNPAVIAELAEQVAPGTVEAPISAVVASTIIISAAVLLGVTFALKPGTDAAIKMQERDSKTGRWRK